MGTKPEVTVVSRPEIDKNGAIRLANELFGLKVKKIKELNGYDDKNYYILVENNGKIGESAYVLKVVNSWTSKDVSSIDAQNAMLLYLADNQILCPCPVKSKSKTYCPEVTLPSGKHVVRLLEYIEGEILYNIEVTPDLFYQVGVFAAKMDKILKNFSHPAYDTYTHPWTYDHFPEITQYLNAISIPTNQKKMVKNVVKEFSNRVLSNLNNLEKGLIHGDINEQNIIVEQENHQPIWKLKAIIDFTDATVSCYLFELAITMTYMILQGKNLDVGGYVLAGYTSVRNLPDKEFVLLKICIAARLCQSLVMGAYTSLQDPSNIYVTSTAKDGWRILTQLWQTREEMLLEKWKNVSENFKATL